MSHRRITEGPGVPSAAGAYVPAVVAGTRCYVSGQLPFDPASGELVRGTIEEETRRTLANVLAVLAAAGFAPGELVLLTVLLADIDDWPGMDGVLAELLDPAELPARVAYQAGAIPLGARLEIQAIAERAL